MKPRRQGPEGSVKRFSANPDAKPELKTPPGWYSDPDVFEVQRWWGGEGWTDVTRPAPRLTFSKPPTDPTMVFVLSVIVGGIVAGAAIASDPTGGFGVLVLGIATLIASVAGIASGVAWGIERADWVRENREYRNAE